MESAVDNKEARAKSTQRDRLVGFAIVVVAAILVLRMIGAPTVLILEVFGLAAILGISAVILILFSGRKIRFR